MNDNDIKLMKKLLKNKGRYTVYVDNDSIHVYDNKIDDYIEGFDGFGDKFIIDLFNYLGIDADGV